MIVPHLTKTYLDGAAFYHRANPVIALTLRYDRLDSFWFNLLHEAAHILLKHVEPNGKICFDSFEDRKIHWTPSAIDFEQAADNFVKEQLIPSSDLKGLVDGCAGNFSVFNIQVFAESILRHPSIVLGRLQHDNLVKFNTHRHLLSKVKEHFSDVIDRSVN